MIFSYPDDMDVDMIPLCEILNSFKGITTMYSCCGHEGKECFYISLVCTSECLEVLYEIFNHKEYNLEKDFRLELFNKKDDEINYKFIKEQEKKIKDHLIYVGIYYGEYDNYEGFPIIKQNSITKICIKAMKVLVEKDSKAYFDYLYVANEMNKIRESLPKMCNYKYISDKEK